MFLPYHLINHLKTSHVKRDPLMAIHIADQLLKLREEVAHLHYSLDTGTAPGDMIGNTPPFLRPARC